MGKNSGATVLADPKTPKRSWFGSGLWVLMGLAMSPLVYEAALLCLANWRVMQGGDRYVATPALDRVSRVFAELRYCLGQSVNPIFHDLPWRPEYVLGLAAAWAFGGGLLLRTRWR